ncbi:WYL domain-containing protein [Pseudonocardia sp.]|uniref:helix-turn-helix transcriptional regulator n=1 Tax=Pseudonocardia sp. TaxID=60912 RepID=UPI00261C64E8|nr:WYL domain-containing protein [Pseudonocardia sp.]
MHQTTSRVLALLALLQVRPHWTGPELAGRLGVSDRTIRKDIDRLRELGYPVDGVRGTAGHYKLGAGGKLPPLLLDDDEAVAIAVGLRGATGIAGIEESSARALEKLDHVLPHRLRRQVGAIHSTTTRAPDNTDTNVEDPVVDAAVLTAIASAIRDGEYLRVDRTEPEHDGAPPLLVEPYRLVSWVRHWYLVAREPDSGTWRTFRVDRIGLRMPTHRRFAPSPLPGGDYTSFVLRDVASTGWAVHARITVFAAAEEVLARINPTVGVVESVDATTSVLVTGADSLEVVAVYVGMLGLDFRVTEPPALVEHLRVLAQRYAAAVGG